MKKKGTIARLAVVALVLCLITMSLTAGTLAKYASTVSGNASAVVAKWDVKFTDGTDPITSATTIKLSDSVNSGANLVVEDRIAPGTSGQFDLALIATGTEVAFDYTISLEVGKLTEGSTTISTTAPLKFYEDAAHTKPLTTDGTGNAAVIKFTDTVNPAATATTENKVEKTIYWAWDSSAITIADVDAGDATDTKLGEEADTFTIPVTFKAEQKVATVAP